MHKYCMEYEKYGIREIRKGSKGYFVMFDS